MASQARLSSSLRDALMHHLRLEREQGTLTNVLSKHDGPMNEDGKTAALLLEVDLDGPRKEEDLFLRHPSATGAWQGLGSDMEFTAFTRRCQEVYLQSFGRRFIGLYNTQRGRGDRQLAPRAGTHTLWCLLLEAVALSDAVPDRSSLNRRRGGGALQSPQSRRPSCSAWPG